MLNVSTIMGRLTADAELRTTQSGTNYTKFCVAVDRAFQKQGEEKQTDFINVVAWSKTAEFITRYFFKGHMIAINGSIQTGSYTDKDGNKRNTFEVVASNVSFCGSKNETQGTSIPTNNSYSAPTANQGSANSTGGNGDFDEIITDDDLPF